jgi:imidazolonepropionase
MGMCLPYYAYILEMAMQNNRKDVGKQWDVLWVHVHLATMAGLDYGIVENGALAIKDGRIAWAGKADALPGAPQALAAEVHDAKGAWMTPGLIDCHTHLVYAGNRAQEFEERMKGKSYADIAKAGGGILSTVRATRAASEAELFAASEKRLISFLKEGVTTMEIKSGYGLDTENEIKMLSVARLLQEKHPVSIYATFLGAHCVPPEFAGRADAYVDALCNEMIPVVAKAKLASAADGFCENIAFSAAQMEKIFSIAQKHGLRVKLHAGQLSDLGGAELAARFKALSADHLEYVSEEGVKAMQQAGMVAVLLPGAFYVLRETKKPPVDWLRKYNVPIAIASDCNPGTSPATSLLLMLNMACVLFNLTPEEALQGVTRNAARALGLANEAGTLEAGKAADIALWDIAHPADLAYNIGYNPCIGIIKHGNYRKNT